MTWGGKPKSADEIAADIMRHIRDIEGGAEWVFVKADRDYRPGDIFCQWETAQPKTITLDPSEYKRLD